MINLLAFMPWIGGLARLLTLLVAVFGLWTGVSIAHGLRGWRTLIFPIIYVIVGIMFVVFIGSIYSNVEFALSSLLADLGWIPTP